MNDSKQNSLTGFTLVELLITAVVAVLVIGGVFLSLINSMMLNEFNEKFSVAMNIARTKLEEQIAKKSGNFSGIVSDTDNGNILSAAADGIDGLYRIDVSDVSDVGGELKGVQVTICWRQRAGRIIGDCQDDGAGALQWAGANPSSPCILRTTIAKR